MAKVEVYSGPFCPYCARAKALFEKKGVAFTEIDIWAVPEEKDKMLARSGGRQSIPQIFINDQHIGGCDDLYALDAKGGLDPLLA